MKNIYEYILLLKQERQSHLKLNEPCVERGAGSYYFKGLLAHYLDTTVPTGHKIHLCHACHNGACGNPNHMYWGTAQENRLDQVENNGKTIWERTVEKHGLDKAKAMNSRVGNNNGSGNKGKPKSEEHKAKIAANRKGGRQKRDNALVAKLVDAPDLGSGAERRVGSSPT
jgi:hypothetical protein